MVKLLRYSIVGAVLLSLILGMSAPSISGFSIKDDGILSSTDIYYPQNSPDLLTRTRTLNFIHSTQSLPEYNSSNLDLIYYRLATLQILDPGLTNLTQSMTDLWISKVLTFQNPDGGFGNWEHDRSSLSNTKMAIEVLSWLNALSQVNSTQIGVYLNSLRHSLTGGFTSHRFDGDSDVYTSYLGIVSYNLLGLPLPNATLLETQLLLAQNNNTDTLIVPANEYGGYGSQTNNIKGIYWTSEVTVTRAAVLGLSLLGSSGNNTAALNFVKQLQTTTGNFVNDPVSISESVSYSAVALELINHLGGTPSDATKAKDYLLSQEQSDGSFRLKSTSVESSLIGTYFAVKGLYQLGQEPSNVKNTIDYITNWVPNKGGYGGTPGEEPSLRETYDAVAALDYMGVTPSNVTAVLSYADSYRNLDGGYGLTGSYVESTLRVVEIYNILGVSFPNPTETINFLQSLQQPDGGFSKGAGKTTSYVISTYRVTKALTILNALPSNVNGAINYIFSAYNSTAGGFGGYFNDSPDVSSTYRALRTLTMLNDTNYDGNKIAQFLNGAQNPDGGYKRSPFDNSRPSNVSNSIYTYSAMRALTILDQSASNSSGVYSYITSVRNFDGGFAEHPNFGSDISYTFTSLWYLSNLNQIEQFSVAIPKNHLVDVDNATFPIEITGNLAPISFSLQKNTTTIQSGQIFTSSVVGLNVSTLLKGNHTLDLYVVDPAGQEITVTLSLEIDDINIDTTTDPNTTPSLPLDENTSSILERLKQYGIYLALIVLVVPALGILVTKIRK